MAFFEWKAEYNVGIKKIDAQHQEIVSHLNNLFQTMKDGKGRETMDSVMKDLVQYTKTHFATEESLMKVHRYPEYEEHRQKHQKMTDHVLQLKQKLDDGALSSPIQITNFLKDWLAKHIMGTDKAYAPFLNSKGIK